MKPKDKRERKEKYAYEYLPKDGWRTIMVVKFPNNMTGRQMTEALKWAKSWTVAQLYDDVIVIAYIKPPYLKHFKKDNKGRFLNFKYTENKDLDSEFIEVPLSKNSSQLFNI